MFSTPQSTCDAWKNLCIALTATFACAMFACGAKANQGTCMGRLDAAMKHFSSALESLGQQIETASVERKASLESMEEMAHAEELRAERDKLLARIAEIENESRALAGVTHEVESKLDGAIAELREALALVA
jgi:hypothetical protein